MLARNVGIRAARQCTVACTRRSTIALRTSGRRFSSTGTAIKIATPAAHPLAGIASQIDHVAPRFEIDPSQITILDGPVAFYDTLKVRYDSLWATSKVDRK